MRLSAKFLKLTWVKVVDEIANIHKDLKAGNPSIADKLKLVQFESERKRGEKTLKKEGGLTDPLVKDSLKTSPDSLMSLSLREISSVLDSLVKADKHYHYALSHFPSLLRVFIVKLVSLENDQNL